MEIFWRTLQQQNQSGGDQIPSNFSTIEDYITISLYLENICSKNLMCTQQTTCLFLTVVALEFKPIFYQVSFATLNSGDLRFDFVWFNEVYEMFETYWMNYAS